MTVTPSFNYAKLRGKIREVYRTERNFATALGIGRVSLSMRLQNRLDFSRLEMIRACDLLGINRSNLSAYFFTEDVQKGELSQDSDKTAAHHPDKTA